MKRSFSFLLVSFVAFFFSSTAFAADVVSPALLIYQVEPGEEFSLDVVFRSDLGGMYDVELRERLSSEIEKTPSRVVNEGIVNLEYSEFDFEPGVAEYIPVTISVPEDQEDGDLYYAVVFHRQSDSQYQYELSTNILLAVGEGEEPVGELQDLQMIEEEDGNLKRFQFEYLNQGQRFSELVPVLKLSDENGALIEEFKGEVTVFLPGVERSANLFFRKQEGYVVPAATVAMFQVQDKQGVVIAEQMVDLKEGKVLAPTQKEPSPVKGFRERRRFAFLYEDWFRGLAILIGLTLVAGSFYLKK